MKALITVHRLSPTGGRRVTTHGTILGIAYDDWDLIELARGAGIEDPESLVGDDRQVEWRGGHPHQYEAA
ncbi:hypothetical protein [Streptomyces sp. NPDC008121]|uniref:hypothetical protein n=1 Tax=Streptomyces sp. NPDC008121 TaxID=3364809 RepID=UPI0036EF0AE5